MPGKRIDVKEALKRIMDAYGETFKRLAKAEEAERDKV